jgi:cell division protein FtsI/penicillin-binding protein 2
VSSFAGALGQPVGEGRLAAATIGTGDVRVSPLDMALAASVVDSGRWHAPSLVTGLPDPPSAPRGQQSPQVLAALRGLMRDAMSTSVNKVADVGGDVYGQAGNAPFSAHHQLRISWFVAYQGDIAFAVVELGKSGSASAAPLAGEFLRNIQAGS